MQTRPFDKIAFWVLLFGTAASGAAQSRPNVLLIFPDNLGWGEVGVYGSVRGVPTPRIDKLAAEGIRLNNFNVEYSCVVSRAALMTGRYAIRTGATQSGGITLWEVTIAEALKSLGYATGLFGKWHLGGDAPEGKREPSHQGFDEFYGIPRTSNEAQTTVANGSTARGTSFIWEGKAGAPVRHLKLFDMDSRRLIDREAAERGIGFMERSVRERKPFFLYYPMTQIHFPTLTHPDFAGKTEAGDIGDAMAEVDHNVGMMLDDRLGIRRNTIVFWCTDNGAESRRPWRGSPGPWSGFSLRQASRRGKERRNRVALDPENSIPCRGQQLRGRCWGFDGEGRGRRNPRSSAPRAGPGIGSDASESIRSLRVRIAFTGQSTSIEKATQE